eukprot:2903595-Amphidinium_carterae.2
MVTALKQLAAGVVVIAEPPRRLEHASKEARYLRFNIQNYSGNVSAIRAAAIVCEVHMGKCTYFGPRPADQ